MLEWIPLSLLFPGSNHQEPLLFSLQDYEKNNFSQSVFKYFTKNSENFKISLILLDAPFYFCLNQIQNLGNIYSTGIHLRESQDHMMYDATIFTEQFFIQNSIYQRSKNVRWIKND